MNYIKDLVSRAVRNYDTRKPFELADSLGIDIKHEVICDDIKGMAAYDIKIGKKWIVLNPDLHWIEERHILAHELGHCLAHPGVCDFYVDKKSFYVEGKLEKQANQFAAELLIPEGKLKSLQTTYENLSKIAWELSVPEKLVEIKLKNFNL